MTAPKKDLAISQSAPRPAKRRTVMLIDGNPEVHALVELQLGDLNIHLYRTHSFSDGLLRLKDCSPDLVLVDYQLLDFGGLELLRKLRPRAHAPPPR